MTKLKENKDKVNKFFDNKLNKIIDDIDISNINWVGLRENEVRGVFRNLLDPHLFDRSMETDDVRIDEISYKAIVEQIRNIKATQIKVEEINQERKNLINKIIEIDIAKYIAMHDAVAQLISKNSIRLGEISIEQVMEVISSMLYPEDISSDRSDIESFVEINRLISPIMIELSEALNSIHREYNDYLDSLMIGLHLEEEEVGLKEEDDSDQKMRAEDVGDSNHMMFEMEEDITAFPLITSNDKTTEEVVNSHVLGDKNNTYLVSGHAVGSITNLGGNHNQTREGIDDYTRDFEGDDNLVHFVGSPPGAPSILDSMDR